MLERGRRDIPFQFCKRRVVETVKPEELVKAVARKRRRDQRFQWVGCVGWMCPRTSDLENIERVLSMNEIASPDLYTMHLPLISSACEYTKL